MKLNFKEIFLLPNLITLFRLFLALPIAYIAFNYNKLSFPNYYLILCIIIAFISDLADGYVARKTNTVTEMGKLLDPLADKLLTAILIILFWMLEFVPLIYLIILLSRDVVIFIGGILLAKKIGTITPSNFFGKFTVFTIGLYFLTILFVGAEYWLSNLMLIISGALSILSIFVYLIRGLKLIKLYGNL
ncbi:MAG: CDP-diacylglycerol--glycerol-3-phosphate 3-phosphatidyltransferase [Ignavibacteria bacterium]|nr:MAG: CDP-diacylglycerol--glycerol-3-phosphate 3-phosphatidyltransferase [Ignavibacteria bacterium]KAF0162081.1 MAG: CDP-diacylglycerol--glycerol-3-phosphate 3-phosphatidyltransferase [Ignavibacteria bacterium]